MHYFLKLCLKNGLIAILILFISSCRDNSIFPMPIDKDEYVNLTVDKFIKYRQTLSGHNITLFGYLVQDEIGFRILDFEADPGTLDYTGSLRNSVYIKLSKKSDEKYEPNLLLECKNNWVSVKGVAGYLRDYESMGIAVTESISTSTDYGYCYKIEATEATYQQILTAQYLLLVLGYDVGEKDGRFTPKVQSAVKLFQSQRHFLNQTGIIDDELILELSKTVASQKQNQK